MVDLRRIFIEELSFPFITCSFSYIKQQSKSRNKDVATLDLHRQFTHLYGISSPPLENAATVPRK